MILGRCEDCGKIRKTGLPSDYDKDWLRKPHQSIKWRCLPCYTIGNDTPIHERMIATLTEEKYYLMKPYQVIPFLSSLAAIIMLCLEIAWHT
jgi:hypothetical protein